MFFRRLSLFVLVEFTLLVVIPGNPIASSPSMRNDMKAPGKNEWDGSPADDRARYIGGNYGQSTTHTKAFEDRGDSTEKHGKSRRRHLESNNLCSNGIPGVESANGEFCCEVECDQCGGVGCGDFGGDTDAECCVRAIAATGENCDVVNSAPCIISSAATSSPVSTSPQALYPVPNSVTEIHECGEDLPQIRWTSSSGVAGRMYMEGSGCASMTDLYQTRVESDGWTAKGPIYVLDDDDDIVYSPDEFTGKWLIASELFIRKGAVFYCVGRGVSGDCDELRIQSTGSEDFHEIRGHGGSLYFENATVTSWDPDAKASQTEYENGRSFLNCVSEYAPLVDCDGMSQNDYGECRMDIINSEIGYLGYLESESYGLTWKVRGFCVDKSNLEIFDSTNVYGNIIGSDIHHNYYGVYSYGHQDGIWTDNKMHDNHQYGFDPHDDSDNLTIARNEVYSNVNHGIIASKRCNDVTIYENTVYGGGEDAVGIFLHRSSDYAQVYDNNVTNMQDAGIAILESFNADIYDNWFENVKYGVRISLGGGNNHIHDNMFKDCSKYGLYTYTGTDSPERTEDGRPAKNKFEDNRIEDTAYGTKFRDAGNTIIAGNVFTGTEKLYFINSEDTTWVDNVVPRDACTRNMIEDDGDPIPASTFTSATTGLPADC